MSLSASIWQLGCRYAAAIIREMELAVAEPSWFYAYLKVHEARQLLRHQAQAMEAAVGERLQAIGCHDLAEFMAWQRDSERLDVCVSALVTAVYHRKTSDADAALGEVHAALARLIQSGLDVLARVEALSGDISPALAGTLREKMAACR